MSESIAVSRAGTGRRNLQNRRSCRRAAAMVLESPPGQPPASLWLKRELVDQGKLIHSLLVHSRSEYFPPPAPTSAMQVNDEDVMLPSAPNLVSSTDATSQPPWDGGVCNPSAVLPVLSMKVMASVAEWQARNAFVKQSSRGCGLLGLVVVLEPDVVAVISPQFSVVKAGVGVFVGECAGVCVGAGCVGGVAVAPTAVGMSPVAVGSCDDSIAGSRGSTASEREDREYTNQDHPVNTLHECPPISHLRTSHRKAASVAILAIDCRSASTSRAPSWRQPAVVL